IKQNKKDEGLTDDEIIKIIKSEAKKRNDAIEAYTKGGRNELAQKEKEELAILKAYLPKELPDEEIEKIVKEAIIETKAESMEEFGNIMKEAMIKLKGQADGKRVSEIVKKLLGE
ncbi:GatB/YqeY domain-containing protein, partial [Candidatus Parcubacteria bacterium]|nr:GatB/YqeY domain-containing protein [Candidatus Parcubacteria bacterium]